MIPNNNYNVLAWYDSVDKQNHRKEYAYGHIYCLATPDRLLLPFQIMRGTRANEISLVQLYKPDGTLFLDITSAIKSTGLSVKRFEAKGYDLIIYPGIMPMAITTPEGQYYAKISDGVETWYSEVFTIMVSLKGYLKLEYWNSENFQTVDSEIDYTDPYHSIMYIASTIGKPEYTFEEDVDKRDGQSFIEKQISEKTYKFNFVAPEFILDALRLVRMHDYVQITDQFGTYNTDTFLITPKWLDQGDLASVETEFQCATVIKKIGKGIVPVTYGDFNADYNNDYNN